MSENLSKYELKFGKHKGEALGDIPASYLLWLADQEWAPIQVRDYVKKERVYLEKEAKE